MGKSAVSQPKYLAVKLLAIRHQLGLSQYRLARMLEIGPKRISEFEHGRRAPSLILTLYYARLAGIPLESIADDDIDMKTFKQQLAIAEAMRDELTDYMGH